MFYFFFLAYMALVRFWAHILLKNLIFSPVFLVKHAFLRAYPFWVRFLILLLLDCNCYNKLVHTKMCLKQGKCLKC